MIFCSSRSSLAALRMRPSTRAARRTSCSAISARTSSWLDASSGEDQKAYLQAITQLLGYLTWRDSKTALIIYVRLQSFSNVLAEVERATPDHPEFVGWMPSRTKRDSTMDSIFLEMKAES